MSKIVDEKVVEMRFDNQNFEKNVKTSMNSLDKLKQSLKFEGADKGIMNMERAINSLSFTGLTSTVSKIADKFTGLELIGTMAMVRIAQSAANAGISLTKSLSVDNIFKGWDKLQQKANSMSTLISQGYKTDVVEKQLDKLLWFSDETSYNFTDMIDNIAKFTATGKGLEDSVTAMQGISLWAAKSGQNAQKASMAMYQLSQALGAGYMRREDWKSIQNYSMDTAEFRQQVLDTAVALGKLKKVGTDTYQSLTGNKKQFTKSQFAENLTEGQWFTADVMMDVYKKYAKGAEQVKVILDKVSDMTNGDLEMTATQFLKLYDAAEPLFNLSDDDKEANTKYLKALRDALGEEPNKEVATYLFDAMKALDKFGLSALKAGQEYRTFNDVIDATKDAVSTKWMKIMETIIGNIDAQKKLWTFVGETFYDWFAGPLDELQGKLDIWVKKGGRDILHKAFSNLGTAIGRIITPIKEAFRDIFPESTYKTFLHLTKQFEKLTSKLIISTKASSQIKDIFKGLFSVLKTGINIAGLLVKAIGKILVLLKPLASGILNVASAFGKWVDKTSSAIRKSSAISDFLNKIVDGIKKATNKVKEFVKETLKFDNLVTIFKGIFNTLYKVGSAVGKVITDIIRNGDLKKLVDILNGSLVGILLGTEIFGKNKDLGFLDAITDIVNNANKAVKNVTKILDGVKDVLKAYTKEINAKTLKQIAISVGILAASLFVLSKVEPDRIGSALVGLLSSMAALLGMFKLFMVMTENTKQLKGIGKATTSMIKMSVALLIFAVAVKKISDIGIADTFKAVTALIAGLAAMTVALNKIPKKDLRKSAKAMISMSLALLVFGAAMKVLATIPFLKLAQGLGAAIVALATMVIALNKLNPEKAIGKSFSLLIAANALIVLSAALKILATMNWSDIGRSLTAMGGALLALVIALNLIGGKSSATSLSKLGLFKSKNSGSIGKSFSLLIAANALIILAGSLKILATMNWSDIGRSLTAMGGALTALVIAMKIMGSSAKTAFTGAGSLLIAADAIVILALGLKILGSMSLESIGKSLLAMAGAFVVLGVAGALLAKVALPLLAVAGAAALFGIAAVTIGAGLALIATGITLLATALAGGATMIASGISAIILGIAGVIPKLITIFGDTLIAVANILIKAAPTLAKGMVVLIYETIKLLAEYTPMIVTEILNLVINILRSVADRIPELIVSIAEVINAVFRGFVEAAKITDPKALLSVVLSIGIIAVAFHLMASLVSIAPMAALGILAFGVLVAELSAVIAALGNLTKIPGYELLVSAGGNVLMLIGEAIGKFVGGIIGGIGAGISNSFPLIAANLSLFMDNLKGFIEGVNSINNSILGKVALLSGAILVLSASTFISGILQLATVGSLPLMGLRLSLFMLGAKGFIEGAKEITPNIANGISYLSKAILNLSTANLLNGLSRIVGFFTGGNSLEKFGLEISLLGLSLKSFVRNIGKFGDEEIKSIKTACDAISIFAKVTKDIPNSGGLKALFEGDNDIAVFGSKLPFVGLCLRGFAASLSGFNDADLKAIENGSKAIAMMSKVAKDIPNSGGLKVLFEGDNDIAIFGAKLPFVGLCLEGFASNLKSFSDDDIKVTSAAANAIKEMASAAKDIPNSGGIKTLFTGDNDISDFADKLPLIGVNLKSFAKSIGKFSDQEITSVKAASEILVTMAKVTKDIPATFGLKQLFTGENDISRFAFKLPFVGLYLRGFVKALGTFDEQQIKVAESASKALAVIANATKNIPASGGIKQLFTGDNDISEFSSKLPATGQSLGEFVKGIKDFTEDDVNKAGLAADTIARMAESASKIPKSDIGIKALFTGDNDILTFSARLPLVAKCLTDFASNLDGFGENQINLIGYATEAIIKMAEAASKIPKTNIGLKALFEGDNDISRFAGKFGTVGAGLKDYASSLDNFGDTDVNVIKTASEALNSMATLSKMDSKNLKKSLEEMPTVGTKMSSFISNLNKVNNDQTTSAKVNVDGLVEMIKKFNEINGNNILDVSNGLKDIGETGVKDFVKALSGSSPRRDISDAIHDLISSLLTSAEAKRKEITSKFESLAKSGIMSLTTNTMLNNIKDAGKSFAEGFANGIDENRYLSTNAGTRLGNAAYNAAKRAIDAHSPSKKAHQLGGFFGLGFVEGIEEYRNKVYDESYSIGDKAQKGLSKAISSVDSILNGTMDGQPTIKPVLDLSDIRSGASLIDSMFNNPILGSNVNAISNGMRQRNQNGVNDEIIGAINKLGSNLGHTGDTYNINGITYGSDSEIANAVRMLIHAANVERRI